MEASAGVTGKCIVQHHRAYRPIGFTNSVRQTIFDSAFNAAPLIAI